MAKNIIFHGLRFGDKQLSVVCSMAEGSRLFRSKFFDKKYGNNILKFEGTEHTLKHRDLIRLLSKGCIKVKDVRIINRVGIFYQYELTNHFKNILDGKN